MAPENVPVPVPGPFMRLRWFEVSNFVQTGRLSGQRRRLCETLFFKVSNKSFHTFNVHDLRFQVPAFGPGGGAPKAGVSRRARALRSVLVKKYRKTWTFSVYTSARAGRRVYLNFTICNFSLRRLYKSKPERNKHPRIEPGPYQIGRAKRVPQIVNRQSSIVNSTLWQQTTGNRLPKINRSATRNPRMKP